MWNLCDNMHGIIYRHIGRTGLGWIDRQKSPVFRRGKSGNPTTRVLNVMVNLSGDFMVWRLDLVTSWLAPTSPTTGPHGRAWPHYRLTRPGFFRPGRYLGQTFTHSPGSQWLSLAIAVCGSKSTNRFSTGRCLSLLRASKNFAKVIHR